MEAWYLGDQQALMEADPRAKRKVLDTYIQDSACGTWELLADAIYPGGSSAAIKSRMAIARQVKYGWAEKSGR